MSAQLEKRDVITFAPILLEAFIVDVDQVMRLWDQTSVKVCMQTCLGYHLTHIMKERRPNNVTNKLYYAYRYR